MTLDHNGHPLVWPPPTPPEDLPFHKNAVSETPSGFRSPVVWYLGTQKQIDEARWHK